MFALEAMGEEGAGDTRGEGGVAASSGTVGGSLVKDTDDPRLFSYIGVLTRADRVDHGEQEALEGGMRHVGDVRCSAVDRGSSVGGELPPKGPDTARPQTALLAYCCAHQIVCR